MLRSQAKMLLFVTYLYHSMIFNLVCKTVVNETPPSVDSSIATESEKGNCVSEEKNDICPANDSKDTILINENNDDDKALFQKESSPIAEQDDSNLSTCSDWFNTTREEMILYEKFGEDYDVVVEKMTKEEKIRLKEEVSKASPKKVEELLGENEVTSKNYNQMNLLYILYISKSLPICNLQVPYELYHSPTE